MTVPFPAELQMAKVMTLVMQSRKTGLVARIQKLQQTNDKTHLSFLEKTASLALYLIVTGNLHKGALSLLLLESSLKPLGFMIMPW